MIRSQWHLHVIAYSGAVVIVGSGITLRGGWIRVIYIFWLLRLDYKIKSKWPWTNEWNEYAKWTLNIMICNSTHIKSMKLYCSINVEWTIMLCFLKQNFKLPKCKFNLSLTFIQQNLNDSFKLMNLLNFWTNWNNDKVS